MGLNSGFPLGLDLYHPSGYHQISHIDQPCQDRLSSQEPQNSPSVKTVN